LSIICPLHASSMNNKIGPECAFKRSSTCTQTLAISQHSSLWSCTWYTYMWCI
jgi:hypothetical protein